MYTPNMPHQHVMSCPEIHVAGYENTSGGGVAGVRRVGVKVMLRMLQALRAKINGGSSWICAEARAIFRGWSCSIGLMHARERYEVLTERTEVPGHGMEVLHSSRKFRVVCVARAYRTHRTARVGMQMVYPYPGYCGTGVQNLQKVRVRV